MFGKRVLVGLLFALAISAVGGVATYFATVPLVPLAGWAWLVALAVATVISGIVFGVVWSVFVAYFVSTQMDDVHDNFDDFEVGRQL